MARDLINIWHELVGYSLALRHSETMWFALTTAALGAFFGAVGAQFASNRLARRGRIEQQIHRLNQVTYLTSTIANSLLNFKDQLFLPFYQDYKTKKQEVNLKSDGSSTGTKLVININGYQFHTIKSDCERILDVLVAVDSADSKIIPLLVTLDGALQDLNISIQKRNDWLDEFRKNSAGYEEKVKLYFGLPLSGAEIDTTYSDINDNINISLDNSIFLAAEVSERLSDRAWRSKKSLGYFRNDISAAVVDFSDAAKRSLMPAREDHKSWRLTKGAPNRNIFESWDNYRRRILKDATDAQDRQTSE